MLRSFQKTVVFRALDVEENLDHRRSDVHLSGPAGRPSASVRMSRERVAALRERARELIKIAGLWDVRHQPAGNLSGGQQKLIQFASMLMPEPKLILLDEPMAGINPKLIERVVESIRFANKSFGVSFLVIEHNIDVVTEHLRARRRARPGPQAGRRDTRRNRSQPGGEGGLSRWLIPVFRSRTCAPATARSISSTASTSTCRRASSSP